ncbi:MAG: winged helix-turn-helix domain-containing protein [Clostridia bacterium]|nr:winged helix-turn-helix domain-containing protein [Clostridia bacterium]
MLDRDRFALVKSSLDNPHLRYNIGTYKERSQHLLLKLYYEPDMKYHEVPYEGYIADILNNQGITEIQTAGFRTLHAKLAAFLSEYPVTVVYPVSEKKRSMWIDPESGDTAEGKYMTFPKARYRLFSELLAISEFINNPGLTLHIAIMKVSQFKACDGYGKDKKRRATKIDTVPDDIIDIIQIKGIDDLKELFPFEKGERITNKDISKKLGLVRMSLWRAVKFLTNTDIIAPSDKIGKSIIYEVK